ncbi:lactococcin 972 family bacteriocin [Curtobacterium aetherium]|uniref:lactococcin 972 family bacteriocin n=1 Tax=Curtobacterium aetherium TaxID=2841594 RepID=UPI003B52501F
MQKKMIAAIGSAVMLAVGWGACSAAAAEPVGSVSAIGAVREGGASADEGNATRNGWAVVGGGTWSYGVWDGEVHSVYANDRSTHRASVKARGTLVRTAWVPPRTIAHAHARKGTSGNQAFWATRG